MDKERLNQLFDRYTGKANKANYNYQTTGVSRYLNDFRNYDELTDIIALAINAVDEHNKLSELECALADLAQRSETGEDISQDLLRLCVGQKIYRKRCD